MSERVLMKGNEALAEAAIRAGCRHFFGYPITPQTELAAYMSKVMPKIGGTYLQAESEIAAVVAKNGMRAVAIPFRSTAENLARHFYGELKARIPGLCRVKVWETPDSCAEYSA